MYVCINLTQKAAATVSTALSLFSLPDVRDNDRLKGKNRTAVVHGGGGGGGGESRDLGPIATPAVDGDTATVDGDGGREVKRMLYGTIWLHTI